MFFLKSSLPSVLLVACIVVSSSAVHAGVDQGTAEPIELRQQTLLEASPQTILRMRAAIQAQQAARQAPVVTDFEPEIPQDVLDIEDMFELSLEPDQPAPKVFLAKYQSTAISFVDAYGNPWPIRSISSFLTGLVHIEKAIDESQSNTLATPATADGVEGQAASPGRGDGVDLNDPQAGSFTLTALKHGVVGNITVYLVNLSTPISIKLIGKSGLYHRVATLRINDSGPQTDVAAMFAGQGVSIGTENDPDLNNALYGVGPLGSEAMVVEGAEGKAWIKGDFLYLQTSVAVFSPKIYGTLHGNGRYRAYKLEKTTTVMATTPEGRTLPVKILRHPSAAINSLNNGKGYSQ